MNDTTTYMPPDTTSSSSFEHCIHSRRCFMSGEYCSKQLNIYQDRKKLHDKHQINAFVVMNFSDMSDVVYKWRLRDFVKSLSKYLYINKETQSVVCSLNHPGSDWNEVTQINVLRADSNPASNYVVCNRVCQQMQIADLVIVDVTVENTNVFYEFGMAVALGKLILPICYNDRFYFSAQPKDNSKREASHDGKQKLEKHIDCFKWRRRLFEYFGLKYRNNDSKVQYFPYKIAADIEDAENHTSLHGNNFSDIRYKRFPYHQFFDIRTGAENFIKNKPIGENIYTALANSYNGDKGRLNTLVIYTMDGFVNEEETPRCIINFHEHITSMVKKLQCFCGDRVVTLVQEDAIGEDNKDSREKAYLPYKVGDLIHIGMNQATYVAQRDKIVTPDFLNTTNSITTESERNEIILSVKKHIGNKSLMIPLVPPIYVEQVKQGLQQDIFRTDDITGLEHFFCFFHVMLRTLRYANEIVVDISNNSIEALFWLGMAHGADIQAITVRYDRSDKEKAQLQENERKAVRKIFDVAGLWTAVLKSNDTEGFYRQLELAQTSIEQHSKLMLKNADTYAELMLDYLREAPYVNETQDHIKSLLQQKQEDEALKLESYYRDRFWSHMLRHNRLHLYMPQQSNQYTANPNPEKHRLLIVKWDVDAMSALSHYLSKRKVISEYHIEAIGENAAILQKNSTNFISFGASTKPIKNSGNACCSLAEYINEQLSRNSNNPTRIRILNSTKTEQFSLCATTEKKIRCRGFASPHNSTGHSCYALLPNPDCFSCPHAISTDVMTVSTKIYPGLVAEISTCPFTKNESTNPTHIQLGQLILWRDRPTSEPETIKYQVSLIGASGPATYALTSLLVDENQKSDIILQNQKSQKHLLSQLQTEIRKAFMHQYLCTLQSIDTHNLCAIEMYLSTVLYRYFLPFLSREDECRICNGMTAFLTSLKISHPSKWNDLDIEKSVVTPLKELLEQFQGVEAMYSVKVEVGSSETDARNILNISPASTTNPCIRNINCLYSKTSS